MVWLEEHSGPTLHLISVWVIKCYRHTSLLTDWVVSEVPWYARLAHDRRHSDENCYSALVKEVGRCPIPAGGDVWLLSVGQTQVRGAE